MAAPNIARTVSASEDFASTKEYADYLAGILATSLRELNWLLTGNLDVKNIKSKSIVTDSLAAGSVTAEKMTVSELSAITANLGHITAGLIEAVNIVGSTIIGSLIKTSNSYPRVELSNTTNILTAYLDADNWIQINPDTLGGAELIFSKDGVELTQSMIYSGLNYVGFIRSDGDYEINATGDITSNPGFGKKHRFGSWNEVWSNSAGVTGKSLQTELDTINTTLGTVNSNITSINSNISSINSNISAIWSAISALDSRISALESP